MINKKQVSKLILLFLGIEILLSTLWMIIAKEDFPPFPFLVNIYLKILEIINPQFSFEIDVIFYYECLIGALFLIIIFIKRKIKEYFKNPFYNIKNIKLELIIVIGISIIVITLANILKNFEDYTGHNIYYIDVALWKKCLLAPILEEIIFKGLLYHLLLPKKYKKQILFFIILSFIFTLLHCNYYLVYFTTPSIFKDIPSFFCYFYGILLISFYFIYQYLTLKIYKKTENLSIVILIHIFINLYGYWIIRLILKY